MLARAGCDVGLKDSAGMTGREVAEGEGHVAVVARLLAAGADPNVSVTTRTPGPGPPRAVKRPQRFP